MIQKQYNMKWIYSITKGVRKHFLMLVVAGIALAVVNIGMTTILKQFVDIATGDLNRPLLWNMLLAIAFVLLEGVVCMVRSVSFRTSTSKTNKKLRLELSKKLYNSQLIDIQKSHVGEFMTNVTNDVENVSNCIPTIINQTVGNGLSAVLAIIYIFLLNWKLALLLLVSIPLLILCVVVFSPIVQKASRVDKKNKDDSRIYIQEILQKITILKSCSMGEVITQQLELLLGKKVRSARNLGIAEGGSSFLNNIIGTAMLLIAIGGGAFFVSQGELLIGDMIAVVTLSNYIIWPFTAIGDIISQANQSIVSAERLDNIYSLRDEKKPLLLPKNKSEIISLNLNRVSFAYDESQILDNFSGVFQSNKIIGIVGESGGGKSTLLKVISGLYQSTSGDIMVMYQDGSTYSDSLLQYIGFVPPDNLIFQDTIKANICMSKDVDYERMLKCAKMANIEEYVSSLENQFETEIGDGKQALSSGQSQRIAITRILYQKAEILLFDEPTANLDEASISIFLQTLDQIVDGHICIVVTHDPKVIEHCNVLFEVKNNKIGLCDQQ